MRHIKLISKLWILFSITLLFLLAGFQLIFTPLAQAAPVTNDLTCPGQVALWHMNETTGTTMNDASGHGNNGTTHNVTLGVSGINGSKAYSFNGTSSYVSVPSTAILNPGGCIVTVTIHVNTKAVPPASPDDFDLIRKGDFVTGGSEYKMELQQASAGSTKGVPSCGFESNGTIVDVVSTTQINDGLWHKVTCKKTSTNIQVIVDNGTPTTMPATLGSISNSSPVTIGSHPGADWYKGKLDEASITY